MVLNKRKKIIIGGATAAVLIVSSVTGGGMVLNALQRGTGQLNDGAVALEQGAEKIVNGASTLKDGSQGLYTGIEQYTQGVSALGEGTGQLHEGMKKYTGAVSLLKQGADGLYNGVYGYTTAVNGMHQGIQVLDQGASVLEQGISGLSNGAGKLSDGTETLNDGMKMLDENSKALLAAPDMIVDGLTQLKQGLNVVPSETDIQKLMQGSTTVKTTINGMSQVATGIDTTVLTLQTTINGLKQTAYSSQELNQFAQLLVTDPGTALSLPNAQGMIQAMAGAYVTTSTALDGASTTITGMKNYTSQLSTGLSQLNQNYQYIDAGVQALAVLPTAAKALEQGMNGMIGVIQKEKMVL